MYMAIDTSTKGAVISLDQCWLDKPEALRARAVNLECSCCHGPVLVRAGEYNKWHFAHKNANDCPLSHTDPDRMLGRAKLFEWLSAKGLRERLSIEEIVKVDSKMHQVDCVVSDAKANRRFAYLFFAAGVRDREHLFIALKREYCYYYPVFHSKTIKPAPDHPGGIILSTTHRDAIHIYSDTGYYHEENQPLLAGRALHALDITTSEFTTYRELSCKNPPKVFAGTKVVSRLVNVRISPKTGELIHLSEQPLFEGRKQKRLEEEQERKKAKARMEKRRQR